MCTDLTIPKDEPREEASEIHDSHQPIIFRVPPDPVPHQVIFPHDGQCPIVKSNADGIDIVLALQLFELQPGMRWILLKQQVRAFRFLLNVVG